MMFPLRTISIIKHLGVSFRVQRNGQPLKTKNLQDGDLRETYVVVFEHIEQHRTHHRTGTVTMEKHPHRGGSELQAAIHPCRHAVMKKIGPGVGWKDRCRSARLRSKFIQSVVPTIIMISVLFCSLMVLI